MSSSMNANQPPMIHPTSVSKRVPLETAFSQVPDLSTQMTPVVSIQQLNHYFGQGSLAKQILFEINLTIYSGEIVILTGPSGSGKTTLLTLMGALRSVQSGSMTILGHELYRAPKRQLVKIRRNIGYIFQGHNLLPFMTARQNVRMSLGLKPHNSRREALARVDQVLQDVGLGDRLNYYPSDLSGGQKQRVAIARALVNQASLILADEPTASLDSKSGRDVVEIMYRLAKEQGSTIVLVTHDNRILDIADRIVHLEDGHLVPQTSDPLALSAVSTFQPATSSPNPVEISPPAGVIQSGSMQPWKPIKIVCIDDSLTVLSSLKAFLSHDLFEVTLIQDPVKALVEIIKVQPDIVILDIQMPGLDGFQLCTLLRAHNQYKNIPVIAITGSPEALDRDILKKVGITDALIKPFDSTDLTVKIFPYLSQEH